MPQQQVEGWMRHFPFLRQRMPFLPLVGLGALGIAFAEWLPVAALIWMALVVLAAGIFFFGRRWERAQGVAFGCFVVGSFALVHLAQDKDSLAARSAAWLGNATPVVKVTGTVNTEPRVFSERSASFELRVESVVVDGRSRALPIRVSVHWPGEPPHYGDRLRITGVLERMAGPRNPGQFDFAAWEERAGIYWQLEVAHPLDAKLIAPDQGSWLVAKALKTRDAMGQRQIAGIDDPVVSELLVAMVLGDTSTMPDVVQKEFRGTGTFHLFSVSGLHVGILSLILWYILRTCGVTRPWAALVIIPALFFYALMTGFQAACVRSAVMGSVVLAGFFFNRRPLILNNLCAAGFLILLYDSNQLFNAGFQLSFVVVAVILLIADPLTEACYRPFELDPFFPPKLLTDVQRFLLRRVLTFMALIAVSLAAWAGSLPLTLKYFNMISLSALPANLLAVPLSFGIMVVSALSLGTSLASSWVSGVFNQTNWLLTKALLAVIHFFASLPGSYVYLGPPPGAGPLAELVVFDAGAGGAIWLRSEGRAWMIDCGSVKFGASTVQPFLRAQGRMDLDGLILTHGDAQHIGGAEALLMACPPRLVVDSAVDDRSSYRNRIFKALADRRFPKSIYRAGDEIRVSPVATISVLYPPSGIASALADDKAFVLRLKIGETRILLMSDSGAATEGWLLAHAREELPCDLLVKGMPRSGSSGSEAFLDAARPKVIISSGAKFPASEMIPEPWAAMVRARGISLLRQDVTGAVTIKVFAHSWETVDFLSSTHSVFAQ